jgi:hypothetical protein
MTPQTAFIQGTNISDENYFRANSSTAAGLKSTETQVIESHDGWVAVIAMASIVMILASLVHPVFHYFFIRGPDLMLNISSLATKNNPYMAISGSGTFMAASDRARLLKGMKVRFGDVGAGNEAGTLAIGSIDSLKRCNVATLRGGHLYE